MPAYLIVESKVLNPDRYREYQVKVAAMIAQHGGRYLSRGWGVTPLSEKWTPERVILIEFPDEASIRAWLDSPEYKAIAPLREAGADTRAVILSGTVD